MKPRAHGSGTVTRSGLDTRRLAESLRTPGIDPRHWVSYGTVGTVGDKGEVSYTDTHAIYIGPEGVEVDVILEPSGIACTCHYAGIAGGVSSTILAPIHPGDRVLVCLPDGDFSGPPTIVAILHSAAVPVPLGADRKPVFKNDRIFVWGQSVPVEVNATAVRLGDETSNEPFVLGNTYTSEIGALLDALKNDVRPSPVGPISPSAILTTAIDLFKTNQPTQLSDFIFGKKTPPSR
jgi:hypothetical protein